MRLAAAVAVAIALLSLPVPAQGPGATDPVMQSAVDGVIRPAVIGFARETSGLANSVSALCAKPSPGALAIAADQFVQAVEAYGRVEPIELGLLAEAGRAERVLFWPDPDGATVRDVAALLTRQDTEATDPATLAGMGGTVQGLGALEQVFFGPEAAALTDGSGDYRCRYGLAVAQALALLGRDLASAWFNPDDISVELLAPGRDSGAFSSRAAATAALVGVLVEGLAMVREERVAPFMDGTPPPAPVLFRSGLTMRLVGANVQILRDLFNVSGIGLRGEGGDADLVARVDREFSDLSRALEAVTLPVDQALADPQQRGALNEVVQRTEILQVMIGEQLAAALGVTAP